MLPMSVLADARRHRLGALFYWGTATEGKVVYSVWRAVDLLVQVELTGGYDREPVVTAQNTLTLLRKETGIG